MAVTQKFIGDSNQLIKEYEKILAINAKMQAELAKNADLSKRNADAHKSLSAAITSSVAGTLGNLASVAAGYLSIEGAINRIIAAEQNRIKLSEDAKNKQVTLADAQAVVLLNLGNVSDQQAKQFLDRITKIQESTNFDSRQPLLQAAASVLSATAGNQDQTLSILQTAAPFFKHDQASLATFGGAMGDIMRVSGLQSSEQAMAMMLAIQGQARFENMAGFKNVAPALAAASGSTLDGDRAEIARQYAAVFAGVSGAIGDVEGAVTKTAVAQLSAKLRKEFGDEGDAFAKLSKLQAMSEKQRTEFFSKGFEAQVAATLEQIAKPDSPLFKQILASYQEINPNSGALAGKRAQLQGLTPELRERSLTSMDLSSDEQFLASLSTDEARVSAILNSMMSRQQLPWYGGFGLLEKMAVSSRGALGGWDPEFGLTEARRMREDLPFTFAGNQQDLKVTEKYFDKQIQILEQINANTRKSSQVPAGARMNTYEERD